MTTAERPTARQSAQPTQAPLALLRLCQLVSPAVPVGAYHFSQGLEFAAQEGWVRDEASALEWILGIARHAAGTLDVPILLRMHRAWSCNQENTVTEWSARLVAARETSELRAEERHLGTALARVLIEIGIERARPWIGRADTTYASMFALAAADGGLDEAAAAQGYLWNWAENQVLCALKLSMLGQSAGQRLLNEILRRIPSIVEAATRFADDDIGVATPSLGLASAWHEEQYSRLFRS
jgi:urease accessory protein